MLECSVYTTNNSLFLASIKSWDCNDLYLIIFNVVFLFLFCFVLIFFPLNFSIFRYRKHIYMDVQCTGIEKLLHWLIFNAINDFGLLFAAGCRLLVGKSCWVIVITVSNPLYIQNTETCHKMPAKLVSRWDSNSFSLVRNGESQPDDENSKNAYRNTHTSRFQSNCFKFINAHSYMYLSFNI